MTDLRGACRRIATTVVLVAATVALTLWWTGGTVAVARAPSLTVKRVVDCHEFGTARAPGCAGPVDVSVKAACANSDVQAVDVAMALAPGFGTVGPVTFVC